MAKPIVTKVSAGIYDVTFNGKRYGVEMVDSYGVKEWMVTEYNGDKPEYLTHTATKRQGIDFITETN